MRFSAPPIFFEGVYEKKLATQKYCEMCYPQKQLL